MAEQATHNYHPIAAATAAWEAMVTAEREHATRTAAERETRDRQRKAEAVHAEQAADRSTRGSHT